MNSEQPSKWVCYYRCSTDEQGRSGLGVAGQRATVAGFLANKPGEVILELTEIESGRKANRPKLMEALEVCRKRKAHLVIAKLDRLARSVRIISTLMDSGVSFSACDMPLANRFVLHIYSAVAEEEARLISERTKSALLAAKNLGIDIGATGRVLAAKHKQQATERAEDYRKLVADLRSSGFATVRGLRDALNEREVASPGGGRWHIRNTFLLLRRLGLAA
ncbi:recombinase family protein [Luteolibacter soli]|uniref:Recombinase family protein n=1 Tax=Luteolibacter soli TaxID=3135280 RepID=A0ABU9B340_9BACT